VEEDNRGDKLEYPGKRKKKDSKMEEFFEANKEENVISGLYP